MTLTTRDHTVCHNQQGDCLVQNASPNKPGVFPWQWLVLVALSLYLLFCHFGCHGDEDNELFARIIPSVKAN
ncbi:MAG: hypothetical protein KatS3mg105_1555 [Gemmatales bacterium]|nr:MAG: hypothetical protein KatS3mg105_1555 [Gemmatales bacterium]